MRGKIGQLVYGAYVELPGCLRMTVPGEWFTSAASALERASQHAKRADMGQGSGRVLYGTYTAKVISVSQSGAIVATERISP